MIESLKWRREKIWIENQLEMGIWKVVNQFISWFYFLNHLYSINVHG